MNIFIGVSIILVIVSYLIQLGALHMGTYNTSDDDGNFATDKQKKIIFWTFLLIPGIAIVYMILDFFMKIFKTYNKSISK